jgi:hypothetical protein
MGSRIRFKTLTQRAALLLSAGLLVQSDVLFAAELAADAQTQARDLLTGTVNGRPRIVDQSPSPPSDGTQAAVVDAQEQARRLILGPPSIYGTTDETAAIAPATKKARAESARGEVYGDPQVSARRMILGGGVRGGDSNSRG